MFTYNVAHAQVTLTINPSVVSNTYPGVITLNITGLNTGEKIYIGKWLDVNGNGVIDAGEPLMEAFQLVDNTNSYAIVGGVTNINMPFDINPANGAITATLSIPSAMPLENMAGNYIFEVISPKGRFAPVTAAFSVTNAPLPALITGTVYQSDGVTPFANAVVASEDLVHGNVANASVADSNGRYAIAVYPGEYACIGAAMNCYYNQKTAASFNLTNGMTVTNNLTLTNAGPYTISGKIYDESNSNGIPGILLQLQSGNLFEVAFTDTNGNYSAAVSPGFWKVQPAKEHLALGGYVDPQITYQANASTNSVTNFNIGYPKGDALIYGRVTDNAGNPIFGIKMDGNQNNQSTNFDSKGYTDATGDYAIAILDGPNSCNVDTPTYGSPALNYIWNQPNVVNVAPGGTLQENFVGQPIVGIISGHVQDNSGTSVVGVGLYANTTIGGLYYTSLEGTTDQSGNYTLAVAAGTWNVFFLEGGFSDSLDTAGYEDPTAPHYVNVPPTVILNITVYPLGTPVISQPRFVAPGQFGFWVSGTNSVTYTVQVSTNLASANWQNVYSFELVTNTLFITDPSATNGQRFYRIVK